MFARFARAQDSSRRPVIAALVGGALLLAWTVWFVAARVSLYEVSRTARLQVASAPHDVDAPVTGRVVRSSLVLDGQVSEGTVLVELDADAFRLEQAAQTQRVATLGAQLEALAHELASQEQALHSEERASAAQVSEAKARLRASDAVAKQKELERQQLEVLHARNVVASVERDRIQVEATRQSAETEAARVQVDRMGSEGGVKRSDRRAQIARLQAEAARLESERAEAAAQVRILDQKIALHVIRAPVSGRVGHLTDLRPGSVLAAGARVCTIVPSGGVRAVAFFEAASAAGRLRAGQTARLRLLGFPWTKYGAQVPQVDRVGREPKDGVVRAELTLRPGSTAIPLEHGLPASAEVEVEQVSPLSLVLDAAGRMLMTAEGRGPAAP
jgi:membrane fusion protein (multidrug efflux system)